jgi:DNA polymerase I
VTYGIPYSEDALQLLHEGAVTMAEIECNGMGVDVARIDRTIAEIKKTVSISLASLEVDPVMIEWRKRFRNRTNVNSREQLAEILFDVMGYTPIGETGASNEKKKRYRADEEALEELDIPFVEDYLLTQKLQKAVSTNLVGIKREVVNGRIHCFFNLHNAVSYRSTSESTNFQNQPIRHPLIGPMIRSCFIPSPGNQIVEIDYSGAEVRAGASVTKDPTLISYVLDESTDMHRDTALELFMLDPSEFEDKQGKLIRFEAKSNFVFAQFYGSWYVQCAPRLWKAIKDLTLRDGTPLRKHLRRKGIKELGVCNARERPRPGTFEAVVKKTEESFWNERFKVYAQWKKDNFALYQQQGYLKTATGFVCRFGKSGPMAKNDANNYPIQGPAFHCLLWSVIRIVRKEMPKRGMKSKVVGQIHDSVVADVVPAERDEYLGLCKRVMVDKVARHFPWLLVPMKIEADVAPVNGSWAEKKGIEI